MRKLLVVLFLIYILDVHTEAANSHNKREIEFESQLEHAVVKRAIAGPGDGGPKKVKNF